MLRTAAPRDHTALSEEAEEMTLGDQKPFVPFDQCKGAGTLSTGCYKALSLCTARVNVGGCASQRVAGWTSFWRGSRRCRGHWRCALYDSAAIVAGLTPAVQVLATAAEEDWWVPQKRESSAALSDWSTRSTEIPQVDMSVA
eukprot:1330585-Amphidinium_carterae.1